MMREQAKNDAAAAEKAQKEAAKRAEAERKLAEKQAKGPAKRQAANGPGTVEQASPVPQAR
jgi:hypothetical protein